MATTFLPFIKSMINSKVFIKETTASTSSDAKEMLKNGEKPPFVVVAKKQSSGYGQNGNKWEGDAHGNLYVSFALETVNISEKNIRVLPQTIAIEICKHLKTTFSIDAKIKWPNDILANGKKVGGLLLEVTRGESGIKSAVLGVGVNILHDPVIENGLYRSTSLKKEAKCEIVFDEAATALIKCVINAANKEKKQDYEWRKSQWEAFDMTLVKEILVIAGEKRFIGIDVGIGENGELLVLDKEGKLIKILQGSSKILLK